MHADYGDDVQFLFVYCREAHAADSARPTGKDIEQPVSTEERRKVAAQFLKDMDLEIPAVLDAIDDKASKDYASLPDRMYLVSEDGKIAYAGGRGPFGFKPDELQLAIELELRASAKKSDKKGSAKKSNDAEQNDAG